MIQINSSFSGEGIGKSKPKFAPGQIVIHKRYGYRGVIVAVDGFCQAPPKWYHANQTQPNREQPWYHVLVDGSASATYPAEENLSLELEPEPVQHPLLAAFFEGFTNGRHLRNSQPWPG
jgi:heat shock protein HspQ